MSLDFSRIPSHLKERKQWLVWKRMEKPLRNGSIRIGKVPINPVKGILLADWQHERNWLTHIQAVRYAAAGVCDGIGFCFNGTEPFVAIDLDKCVDATTKTVDDWALEIVNRCDSYTELSPSGLGLRIFVGGKAIGVTKVKKTLGCGSAVELFAAGSYVTVTGCSLKQRFADNQDAINWLLAAFFTRPLTVAPGRHGRHEHGDEEVLNKARNARNGELFRALYDAGDVSKYGGDASSADLALVSLLIYWCDGALAQVDRLFRSSALMRPKWDEQHGQTTYGQQTILRATQRRR